jgi:hypothetical protein
VEAGLRHGRSVSLAPGCPLTLEVLRYLFGSSVASRGDASVAAKQRPKVGDVRFAFVDMENELIARPNAEPLCNWVG